MAFPDGREVIWADWAVRIHPRKEGHTGNVKKGCSSGVEVISDKSLTTQLMTTIQQALPPRVTALKFGISCQVQQNENKNGPVQETDRSRNKSET